MAILDGRVPLIELPYLLVPRIVCDVTEKSSLQERHIYLCIINN